MNYSVIKTVIPNLAYTCTRSYTIKSVWSSNKWHCDAANICLPFETILAGCLYMHIHMHVHVHVCTCVCIWCWYVHYAPLLCSSASKLCPVGEARLLWCRSIVTVMWLFWCISTWGWGVGPKSKSGRCSCSIGHLLILIKFNVGSSRYTFGCELWTSHCL